MDPDLEGLPGGGAGWQTFFLFFLGGEVGERGGVKLPKKTRKKNHICMCMVADDCHFSTKHYINITISSYSIISFRPPRSALDL